MSCLGGIPLLSLLRRSEAARLTAAVVLAAGAAAAGESLAGGHHHASAKSGRGPLAASAKPGGDPQVPGSSRSAPGGASRGGASNSGPRSSAAAAGSHAPAAATVANSPAVSRTLRHGWMTVVMDRPPGGVFSEQNRSVAQGATVAVDELNAHGGLWRGIRVKLVRQTLDGLPADVVRRRLESEAAAALILPCDTDSQFGLASAAARFGMLLLAPCDADPTAGRSFPTYWPVGASASDEMLELASFMRMVGYGRVFVVETPGSRYVELLTSWFRSAVKAKGIALAGSTSIAMGARDFSGLARTIQADPSGPAAIFTALPPPYANRLAAGLAAQGVDRTVIGTAVMDTRLSLSVRGESLNGAVFPSLGFPRPSAAARRFAADYRKLFGADPVGGFAGAGQETIRLLQAAAHRARSAEPSAIQRALVAGVTLRGVGLADRSYQAGADHNPVGEVGVAKIASNGILPLFAGMPGGH